MQRFASYTYSANLDQEKAQVTWRSGEKNKSVCLVRLPSADYTIQRKSWLDRIFFTFCLLVISSFALLEMCNLGPPLESKTREGRAGSYHAWLEDIPNGKDNSLASSPELQGGKKWKQLIDQPTNQPKQHLQVEPRARLQIQGDCGVEWGIAGEPETRAKEEEREGFLRTKTKGRKKRIGTSIKSDMSSSVYIHSRRKFILNKSN